MGKRIEIPENQYLKGLKEVNERLQEALDQYEQAGAQGLAKASVKVGETAQDRAPVETGDLRGSLFVDLDGKRYAEADEKGENLVVVGRVPEGATKAFICFDSRYAADQHEHTEYSHPSMKRIHKMQEGGAEDLTFAKAQNGQAKYLESALLELAENGELLERLFGAVKDGFGGG